MAQSIHATDAGAQSLVITAPAERGRLVLAASITVAVLQDGAAWTVSGDPLIFLAQAIALDPSIFNHSQPGNGIWLGAMGGI